MLFDDLQLDPEMIACVGAENAGVLQRLLAYLRTHYELNALMIFRSKIGRDRMFSIEFMWRPLLVIVSLEFLEEYRDLDLDRELDHNWFMPILIHACSNDQMVVLDRDAVELVRRT